MTDIQKQAQDSVRRAEIIRSMQDVLAHPSGTPERWRAAFNHFLRQRPDAKAEADFVAAEVRERRKLMDKFASTKNARMSQSTPSYLLGVLKNTDPEYFLSKSRQQLASAAHLKLMKQAFPEYFYPEVI